MTRTRLAPVGAAAGLLLLAAGRLAAEPLAVAEVAPGVSVHQGVHEDFSPQNRGGIANLAFVVGQTAVAVVDSGGSRAEGLDLLAAIRTRTDLPVRFVVATHDHPDHVLGNAAFGAGHRLRRPCALAGGAGRAGAGLLATCSGCSGTWSRARPWSRRA